MRVARGIVFALGIALVTSSAEAACACRCVNQYQWAVCDGLTDKVPDCRALVCKLAPVAIRPNEPQKIPPPGATRCEQMQVYSYASARYEWTQLCIPDSRSFHGLLKPGGAPLPTPLNPRSRQAIPCGTDRDCPSGLTCKRRSMDLPWMCAR